MKNMIVVNVGRCLGCKSCEMACAVEHSASRTLFEAICESPPPRSRVSVEQGAGFVVPLQCRQCEDTPCVTICPTGALYRADADSPIVIDHERCI
ncbi:MAG: 4Fe-4S dicluster domain-containing protein, partial [Planctomycetota bacterium]